ncbi:hypothetical protein [Bifidobacterium scardovii]|uniref:hypothetical protein n=1 Tax=Bifidobacterium scardovii TaxID=158787 RepID=UPI0012E046DB|nr:hypothetical protein [Bifidobacterium scardovii]MDU8980995.1 hypothetical protein [Bifidobacterium scardovii]
MRAAPLAAPLGAPLAAPDSSSGVHGIPDVPSAPFRALFRTLPFALLGAFAGADLATNTPIATAMMNASNPLKFNIPSTTSAMMNAMIPRTI